MSLPVISSVLLMGLLSLACGRPESLESNSSARLLTVTGDAKDVGSIYIERDGDRLKVLIYKDDVYVETNFENYDQVSIKNDFIYFANGSEDVKIGEWSNTSLCTVSYAAICDLDIVANG